MEQLLALLRKVVRGLRAVSEITATLAALIETFIGWFGPGFGFAA